MTINSNTNILIVGLGVIGGGYADALTKKGYKVSCITKEQKDIDYALSRGMITYGTTQIEKDLVYNADIIIFALYPTVFIKWIEENQHLFKPGCLITDVSGVKSSVIYKVQSVLRGDVEYLSHHPMAGRERSGVEFADKNVFLGANYIITPTEKNRSESIETLKELGNIIGFGQISLLSAEEHDEMIAFLSQLTHCIAIVLMNCNSTPHLEKYTGDSFRDLTRIAKINDRMWSELFLMNKAQLLKQMDAFLEEFKNLKSLIEEDKCDELREMMKASTLRRSLFDKPDTQDKK